MISFTGAWATNGMTHKRTHAHVIDKQKKAIQQRLETFKRKI